MNIQERTFEDIVQAIKEKRNTDFCGVYELYNHDKIKRKCLGVKKVQDAIEEEKQDV